MKRGFVSRKSIFALLVILLVLVLGAIPAVASPVLEPNVCPHGGKWSEHQDPPLVEVQGATKYCVKGGKANPCTGYLEKGNFGYVQGIVNAEGACDLSHWSFRIEEECDPCSSTIRVPQEPDPGEWSEFGECINGFKTRSRTVTTTTLVMGVACGRPFKECYSVDVEEIEYEREECPPEPNTVVVGASFGCSSPDEDGVVWQIMGSVTVSPFGGAVLTLNGWDYEGSHGAHLPFGSYSWSAVANAGYEIVGDSEGSFQITRADCNEEPKEHPPTGPDSALTLPVAVGVVGLALMAMGAKIAFKREE